MRDRGETDLRNYDDDPLVLFETEISSKLTDCLDPAEIAGLDSRINIMMRKVNSLKQVDQDIINLVFVEGLTMKEAAAQLGMSYTTLRVRVVRIRKTLGEFQGDED